MWFLMDGSLLYVTVHVSTHLLPFLLLMETQPLMWMTYAVKYKKFDISELKVNEILRKDYKKWARLPGSHVLCLQSSFLS